MSYPVMPLGFLGSQGDQDTYKIERSLRFNSADSAYLSRTPASAGNQKTWTWSGWVKRSKLNSVNLLFYVRGNDTDSTFFRIGFDFIVADALSISDFNGNVNLTTTQLFRDLSSWYHIVVALDTTQATASNRLKLYVNGSQVTSFSTANYPATQNSDYGINRTTSHLLGASISVSSYYFDGYLTEINFIDGQALTPSYFGETDAITGRWKAKAYSGTYGTNGFYLNFADNSGTTSTTLGKDSSPNGNNWTPNNFSVATGADNDSLLDSPTNSGTSGNYCTLNPLLINPFQPYVSISNGNLYVSGTSTANDGFIGSTFSVKTGKWYWEYTSSAYDTSGYSFVGVNPPDKIIIANGYTGYYPNSAGYAGNGNLNKYGGFISNWGSTWGAGDVIGVALDCDNGAVYFSKNNTWQNSGSPTSGTSKTGAALTWTGGAVELTPVMDMYKSGNNGNINFGQSPFAYTAPTGFRSLCTTNLPQPTIQKPSKYMDVVTYTGTGSALTPTSSLGFSPDLVWIKGRSGATDHALYDTVRGAEKRLESNNADAEVTSDSGVTAFNSNGFTLGTLAQVNTNTATYVAWAWDEAPIAGMDIVSYTGTGVARTVAHNLGVAPKMMIVKNRNPSVDQGTWMVYHSSLSASGAVFLNLTNAYQASSTYWNNTAPTSSVFTVGTNGTVNENTKDFIAYLFAEVEGFSKFGSYTGNGSADGPFVFTGHRPRWVLIKSSSVATSWYLFDTARGAINVNSTVLYPNTADIEDTNFGQGLDFTSNGFKIRSATGYGLNNSGATYIFAAFAESPFKYSRAR